MAALFRARDGMQNPGSSNQAIVSGPGSKDLVGPTQDEYLTRGRHVVSGKCDVCGKAKTFGNNVSFSKKRTNRDFRANVQKKRITVNGVGMRLNICTRCLRTLNKSGKAA